MYAMQPEGSLRLGLNADLREYARLEYRTEDARWILATSRPSKKPARPHRRLRLFARRARPAPRPVACKGTPRRDAPQAAPTG